MFHDLSAPSSRIKSKAEIEYQKHLGANIMCVAIFFKQSK